MFFFVRKQRGRGECCAHCNEEVETIILVDGCKFIEKDAKISPSSGSMIVEIDAAGSGMDEHETSPRGTGTGTGIQNGGFATRHNTEKRRESFLIWPTFNRNFNLQMGKSFNFI